MHVCVIHINPHSSVETTERTVFVEITKTRTIQKSDFWFVRVNFATDETMGCKPDAEKQKDPCFFVFFVKTEAHIFFKVDGQKLKGKDGIKDSCCCCCCCSLHLPPPAHHKALNPSLDCHCSDPPTLYVANTQLSERWTPDRWSTHRQRLLHHRRTDKHWKRVFFSSSSQASFSPQHANSISPPLTASSPVFRVKQVINNTAAASPSSACWRGCDLHKLYCGCGGRAQGRARSLQTNTVTTSLQLSPTPTCSSSS